MDYSETAKKISRKFSDKGIEVDPKKIEGKLHRLIEEFGVQPSEAERSVTNDLAKEFNLPTGGADNSGKSSSSAEQKKIADVAPGEWVTIEGNIVVLSKVASSSIAQSGIIADDSGGIRFVVWAKSNAPSMAEGKWYKIESAVVDEFKGVASLKIHSGTVVKECENDSALIPNTVPIANLRAGVGSIRAKVIKELDTSHDRMLQSGLLGDEQGKGIKFLIWKEEGKEKLDVGKVYNIFYAFVDEFNSRLSLNLNSAKILKDDGDILAMTVKGAVVHIAPGSGLIKRCPIERCNRVLDRQNYCLTHKLQTEYSYDLQIKGWLDDGETAHNILLPRDVVESLTGITLDAAKEIAENNPLGMDEVFLQMRDKILGHYISCTGWEIYNRLEVDTCSRVAFAKSEHTALLNRAGSAL